MSKQQDEDQISEGGDVVGSDYDETEDVVDPNAGKDKGKKKAAVAGSSSSPNEELSVKVSLLSSKAEKDAEKYPALVKVIGAKLEVIKRIEYQTIPNRARAEGSKGKKYNIVFKAGTYNYYKFKCPKSTLNETDWNTMMGTDLVVENYHDIILKALDEIKSGNVVTGLDDVINKLQNKDSSKIKLLKMPILQADGTHVLCKESFLTYPEYDEAGGISFGNNYGTVHGFKFSRSLIRDVHAAIENSAFCKHDEFVSHLRNAVYDADNAKAMALFRMSGLSLDVWVTIIDYLLIYFLFKGTNVAANKTKVFDRLDDKAKAVASAIVDIFNLEKVKDGRGARGANSDNLSFGKLVAVNVYRTVNYKMITKPATLCHKAMFDYLVNHDFNEAFMFSGACNILPPTRAMKLGYTLWAIGNAMASNNPNDHYKNWTAVGLRTKIRFALIGFENTVYLNHKAFVDNLIRDGSRKPYGGSFSLNGSVDPEIEKVVLTFIKAIAKSEGIKKSKLGLKESMKKVYSEKKAKKFLFSDVIDLAAGGDDDESDDEDD